MQIVVPDSAAAIAALRKAKIQAKVEFSQPIELRGTQKDPAIPARIFELAEDGWTYQSIAEKTGVSYATVLRVVQAPDRYGLNGKKPIRRINWRR
jgi:DNA invertase Pin-like site-specific DNA recombinase